MNARTQRIKGQLADRYLHTARPQVAQAQDAFPIGDHNHPRA